MMDSPSGIEVHTITLILFTSCQLPQELVIPMFSFSRDRLLTSDGVDVLNDYHEM